jgi:hypothetical protein
MALLIMNRKNTPDLIPIVISSVGETLPGFTDGPNQYTVAESAEVIATGTLDIPDDKFRVPFMRTDTGRIQMMVAEVINGEFTLTMCFKTGGEWVVNNQLINSSFETPIFSIKPQTFMVI